MKKQLQIHTFLLMLLSAVLFSQDGSGQPLDDLPLADLDLVAGWTFDDADVRALLDATESHIGLRVGATALTHSPVGATQASGAISFDGKSGHVVVRHDDKFLIDAGTMSCWVKARDVQRTQGVLSKDASGFGDGGHITLSIRDGNTVIRLQSVNESHEVAGSLAANRWSHVTVTFGDKGLRLYVDGELVGSNSYHGGLGSSSGGVGNHEPLIIGASTINSGSATEQPLSEFFDGEVDEVAIYGKQLEQAEIDLLIANSRQRFSSPAKAYAANDPIAWWRFNDSSEQTIVFDAVGNQHGTLNVVGEGYFDGDDYVDVGAVDFDGGSFSISANVEPSSFAVADARIIAKENSLDSDDHFWSLSTTIRDDKHRLRFRLTTSEGTREVVASTSHLDTGQSMWILAAYDGQFMRLYQNGEAIGQVKHSGRPKTNAHCHVWIGDTPAGAGKRPFDGSIDEVGLFDRALTADEAESIFEASRWKRTEPLRADLPEGQTDPDRMIDEPSSPEEPKPEEPKPEEPKPEEPKPEEPESRSSTTSERLDRPDVTVETYVPKCPLCGGVGHHGPIRRVSLYGAVVWPIYGSSDCK